MLKISIASPARLTAVLMAACLITTAHAQTPPASHSSPAQPKAPASQTPSRSTANDELLARAAKLYDSSAKAGLNSFTCAVHPEWRTLILSANKGAAVDEGDPRIALLKLVKIALHGQMKGSSTLDWNLPPNPAKPFDEDTANMLEDMHSATNQSLVGFMQFWAPFVDGSVLPASSEGLEITRTETGHRIHAHEGDTSLTELLDNNLVLQHFDVVTGGMTVNFAPTYKPTSKGLLVDAFQAHIQPPGVPPEKAKEMHVEIEYQTLDGFPIPARINMSVVNTSTFNFVLDGCTVNQ